MAILKPKIDQKCSETPPAFAVATDNIYRATADTISKKINAFFKSIRCLS